MMVWAVSPAGTWVLQRTTISARRSGERKVAFPASFLSWVHPAGNVNFSPTGWTEKVCPPPALGAELGRGAAVVGAGRATVGLGRAGALDRTGRLEGSGAPDGTGAPDGSGAPDGRGAAEAKGAA